MSSIGLASEWQEMPVKRKSATVAVIWHYNVSLLYHIGDKILVTVLMCHRQKKFQSAKQQLSNTDPCDQTATLAQKNIDIIN